MSIDPKNLPEDAVVRVDYGLGDTSVRKLGYLDAQDRQRIGRAFVPVPDGVSYEDALRAVEDARPWVHLPDGPKREHLNRTIRREYRGCTTTGVVDTLGDGYVWMGGAKVSCAGDWFVHPDDVPDPDADLIERVAIALADRRNQPCPGWDTIDPAIQEQYRRDARAVLAVVRENEAQR
jgi:hypothetical protein